MNYRGFDYEQAKNKKPNTWRLIFPDGHKVYTEVMTEDELKKALDEFLVNIPEHVDP